MMLHIMLPPQGKLNHSRSYKLLFLFVLYGQLPQQVVVLHTTGVQDTLIKHTLIRLYIFILELTFQQAICYNYEFQLSEHITCMDS